MPSLCDVSFLLPLCNGRHEHHAVATAHLEETRIAGDFVICRLAALGLMRLLNNPMVMGQDACMGERAWVVYDRMMSDPRFVFRPEPPTLETRLREFTCGFSFSPKLWQDAYLAAFAREAGLRMVTFDKGFRQFEGLDCSVLTA